MVLEPDSQTPLPLPLRRSKLGDSGVEAVKVTAKGKGIWAGGDTGLASFECWGSGGDLAEEAYPWDGDVAASLATAAFGG